MGRACRGDCKVFKKGDELLISGQLRNRKSKTANTEINKVFILISEFEFTYGKKSARTVPPEANENNYSDEPPLQDEGFAWNNRTDPSHNTANVDKALLRIARKCLADSFTIAEYDLNEITFENAFILSIALIPLKVKAAKKQIFVGLASGG